MGNEKNLSGANRSEADGANWVDVSYIQHNNHPSITSAGQLQWIDLPSNVYPKQNVSNQRWGSGGLIGVNIFFSAGHCFTPENKPNGWITPFKADGQTQLSAFELSCLMKVNFNFQVDYADPYNSKSSANQNEESYRVTKLLEYRDGKNGAPDYAIVMLDGRPGDKYGFAKIAIPKFNFSSCYIPQHPAGLPKKISFNKILGCQDTTCATIAHNNDTLPGSSGSGLFWTEYLVAIHIAGAPGNDELYNIATTMKKLFEVSPTIRNIILRDAGLFEQYNNHCIGQSVCGIVLGLIIGLALQNILARKRECKKSEQVLCAVIGATFGGIFAYSLAKKKNQADTIRQLSQMPRFAGLSLET